MMSFWRIFEPKKASLEFERTIPGFGRTNTPRKEWTKYQRMRILSNGDKYTLPSYEKMGGHFILLHNWKVECKIDNENKIYIVPQGQATDFASIPRALHSLISPLSNTVYAAVLHDFLYRNPEDLIARSTTRKQADRLFHYGMTRCGVSKFLALVMYWGVRVGGKGSYVRAKD